MTGIAESIQESGHAVHTTTANSFHSPLTALLVARRLGGGKLSAVCFTRNITFAETAPGCWGEGDLEERAPLEEGRQGLEGCLTASPGAAG